MRTSLESRLQTYLLPRLTFHDCHDLHDISDCYLLMIVRLKHLVSCDRRTIFVCKLESGLTNVMREDLYSKAYSWWGGKGGSCPPPPPIRMKMDKMKAKIRNGTKRTSKSFIEEKRSHREAQSCKREMLTKEVKHYIEKATSYGLRCIRHGMLTY